MNSCLVMSPEADGATINTVEGLAKPEGLHPLQQKFLENAAFRCGICTPGFLVSVESMLRQESATDRTPDPPLVGGQLVPLHGLR